MRKERRKSFRILPGAFVYLCLLIFAILFTQFLRSPVSNTFFWFVCFLPIVSLIHTLLGKAALQVFVECDTTRVEKNSKVEYEMRIINNSPLPYPFLETMISEPRSDGVCCNKKKFILSLVSFGGYVIKNAVTFRYRGLYEIGVESIYISDLFRMFAVRLDVYNYAAVTVYPRKMTFEKLPSSSVTDRASSVVSRSFTGDKTELSDIRDYMAGDPVKNIHWKLSSKAGDIKLREYGAVEDRHVYVFCDLAAATHAPEKTASQIYDTLKKTIAANKDRKTVRLKAALGREDAQTASQIKNEATDKKAENVFARMGKGIRGKVGDSKYRRNVRSGMSEEQAGNVRMIDELISSTSRNVLEREHRKKEKEKRLEAAKEAARLERTESLQAELEKASEMTELEKIINAAKVKELEKDTDVTAFGGKVKKEYLSDYDEYCADAVVEMSIAAALSEIRKGNKCTLVWFDRREDSGVCSATVTSAAEFESVYLKLSTAATVDSEARASLLTAAVTEASSVTLKIVTSNIDPVNLAELSEIPACFGGAGTGCFAEVIMFSPSHRFEDPLERRAYTAEAAFRLLKSGMTAGEMTEGTDGLGNAVFVPA